jgi:nucleotide-binding universal stress UspA family protein
MRPPSGGVVLAAVDGSAEAAHGVDVAAELARRWNADLHLVHVWSGLAPVLAGPVAEGAARRLLADEAAAAVRRGAVVCRQHFLVGSAAGCIADLGDELGAIVCVVGQHRHSQLGRLVFGSVAAELLGVTTRPLLLVSSTANWPPRRVVVGDDGSHAALAAAALAADIAALYGSDVELIRADRSSGSDHADIRDGVLEPSGPSDRTLLTSRPSVHTAVVPGSPTAVLTRDADGLGTLVAVGSRQHGGLVRWLEGSVSLELVHTARTVLVVPAGDAG